MVAISTGFHSLVSSPRVSGSSEITPLKVQTDQRGREGGGEREVAVRSDVASEQEEEEMEECLASEGPQEEHLLACAAAHGADPPARRSPRRFRLSSEIRRSAPSSRSRGRPDRRSERRSPPRTCLVAGDRICGFRTPARGRSRDVASNRGWRQARHRRIAVRFLAVPGGRQSRDPARAQESRALACTSALHRPRQVDRCRHPPTTSARPSAEALCPGAHSPSSRPAG